MKRAIFIHRKGRLRRNASNLIFEPSPTEAEPKPKKRLLPVQQISRIYALGELDFNSKCCGILAKYRIPLHLFSFYGKYMATLFPPTETLSGRVHIHQAEAYLNRSQRLHIAQTFVKAAAVNMLRILLYYARRQDYGGMMTETLAIFEKATPRIFQCQDIGELLGVEGNLHQAYLSTYPALMGVKEGDLFFFDKRSRRPPQDAFNALLSFGNALCYAEVQDWLYRTALDPTIGYLHEPAERRNSLALDIAEVFKPVFVDRLVLSIVRRGFLNASHFHERNGGVYLKPAGTKKFLEYWETRLEQRIDHPIQNRKMRSRELIKIECQKLSRYIQNPDLHPYKPYQVPSR
jgi:CRISPR-associated protein Cas1